MLIFYCFSHPYSYSDGVHFNMIWILAADVSMRGGGVFVCLFVVLCLFINQNKSDVTKYLLSLNAII